MQKETSQKVYRLWWIKKEFCDKESRAKSLRPSSIVCASHSVSLRKSKKVIKQRQMPFPK